MYFLQGSNFPFFVPCDYFQNVKYFVCFPKLLLVVHSTDCCICYPFGQSQKNKPAWVTGIKQSSTEGGPCWFTTRDSVTIFRTDQKHEFIKHTSVNKIGSLWAIRYDTADSFKSNQWTNIFQKCDSCCPPNKSLLFHSRLPFFFKQFIIRIRAVSSPQHDDRRDIFPPRIGAIRNINLGPPQPVVVCHLLPHQFFFNFTLFLNTRRIFIYYPKFGFFYRGFLRPTYCYFLPEYFKSTQTLPKSLKSYSTTIPFNDD